MRLALITVLLTGLMACDEESACDEWASYVCACHDGEPEFDCDELNALAIEASPAVIDQCAIDLAAQRAEDQDAGLECELL